MQQQVKWPTEFARVISCRRCSTETCPKFLPHTEKNLPQPGYIGPRYRSSRILFVGQNPGIPKRLDKLNNKNTNALHALRDEPTEFRYGQLNKVLKDFIPQWDLFKDHVPLVQCGLSIEDIAYTNIVRCRTLKNGTPGQRLFDQCIDAHFARWLDLLSPKVVVFLGKKAWEQGCSAVSTLSIPCTFVNRQRYLLQAAKDENQAEVIALVKQHRG